MNRVIYYFIIIQLFIVKIDAIGQSAPCTERVFLQTDREIYVAGENLFFTCFRYDAENQQNWTSSRFAYLILRSEKNQLIQSTCLRLTNDVFSGSLYLPDTLNTGWYQLVSFTNYMRNSGESAYFTKEVLIVNRFDKDFSGLYLNLPFADSARNARGVNYKEDTLNQWLVVSTNKNVYTKREKIRLTLDAFGLKANEMARFSISVRERIPGQVERRLNDQPDRMTQKSQTGSSAVCNHLPEINGLVLEGRALDDENKPSPGTCIFLSTPDTVANLQFTQTDKAGKFRFLLNEYYNDKKLILTMPDRNKGRIELDDKYDLKMPYVPSGLYPDNALKGYFAKSQNVVQIQKTYQEEFVKKLSRKSSGNATLPLAYPPVSDPVFPADFVALSDFVEISREILPLLKTRKHEENYEAHILDQNGQIFMDQPPLIFLDGVPINNINQIIGFGTRNIWKIETVGEERFDGGRYYAGILAVFTKSNEINNIVWKTPALGTDYEKLLPGSVFTTSAIRKNATRPYFHQLLYWEPSVQLKAGEKKNIEFEASDNIGDYEITAEGITTSGNLINAKKIVKVVLHSN